MDAEIWRDIAGYEGLYQVSNFGCVKSFVRYPVGRILSARFKNGYPFVSLHHGDKHESALVHRLVAKAFIPNPDGKPCVNHLNGDKTDNRAENLEWCTKAENNRHAAATDLTPRGENRHDAKLTAEQVIYTRENPDNLSGRELARLFGVGENTISRIQRGVRYKNTGGTIRESKFQRTPDDVREQIRQLYVKGSREFNYYALAKKFGVTSTTIWRIVHEK